MVLVSYLWKESAMLEIVYIHATPDKAEFDWAGQTFIDISLMSGFHICRQTGYLLGMPVAAYSLDIGRAHTDFAEGKMQMRLIERQLEDEEIDTFAIISMAGVASEATKYEEVSVCILTSSSLPKEYVFALAMTCDCSFSHQLA